MFINSKTLFTLAATSAVAMAQSNERGAFGGFGSPAPTPAPCDTTTPLVCPDGTEVFKTTPDCVYPDCPTPDTDPSPTEDPDANVKGDPHFFTFGGERFDYHGQCDLVLLKNPLFKQIGMEIHIRTKITDWWSAVEAAAIKLGDDVIEVNSGNLDEWFYLNGQPNEKMVEKKFYQMNLPSSQDIVIRYRQQGVVREFNIYFEGNRERLQIRTYKDFVRVDVDWKVNPGNYKGAIGLLGSFDLDGKRVARDGKTYLAEHNAFGQEWQVTADEPKLFHSYEGAVQAPKQCILPLFGRTDGEIAEKALLRKRRLENGLKQEAVEKACAHLKTEDERKGCEYDVIATQDLDYASVY